MPVYYAPIYRDFPEFWDYGAQWEQYLCSDGAAFADNDTCLTIYSIKHDPVQDRTAAEIARFSKRDAENWLRLWRAFESDEIYRVMIDNFFYPPEQRGIRARMPGPARHTTAIKSSQGIWGWAIPGRRVLPRNPNYEASAFTR